MFVLSHLWDTFPSKPEGFRTGEGHALSYCLLFLTGLLLFDCDVLLVSKEERSEHDRLLAFKYNSGVVDRRRRKVGDLVGNRIGVEVARPLIKAETSRYRAIIYCTILVRPRMQK